MKQRDKSEEGSDKRYRVALFVETSQEFGRDVLFGIREYERKLPTPWRVFLNPDGAMIEIPNLRKWNYSGIIARVGTPEMAKTLLQLGVPVVLLDPSSGVLQPNVLCAPVISTDTDQIVRMAYDHLRGCGCQNFAFVHSSQKTGWSISRGNAFHKLLISEGYTCEVFPPQRKKLSWSENIRLLGVWLQSLPPHTGVFAAMDERGRQVIEACHEVGIRVPDDLAVIGVDNDPLLCELSEPTLTSIALNAFGAGIRAASLLHQLMEGAEAAARTIPVAPTHIARRKSTAIGYDNDPIVAVARNFIFTQVSKPQFQIPDIARHCHVSRRLLESRFLHATGKTLLQTVTMIRMEKACTLLRDTLDSVADIGRACGFSDANYFTKAFRKSLGVSPKKYRSDNSAK